MFNSNELYKVYNFETAKYVNYIVNYASKKNPTNTYFI